MLAGNNVDWNADVCFTLLLLSQILELKSIFEPVARLFHSLAKCPKSASVSAAERILFFQLDELSNGFL